MGALWEPSGGIRGALLEGLRGFCGCAVGPFSFAPGARFCQPVDIKHSFWGTSYHPNRWPGDPIRGHCLFKQIRQNSLRCLFLDGVFWSSTAVVVKKCLKHDFTPSLAKQIPNFEIAGRMQARFLSRVSILSPAGGGAGQAKVWLRGPVFGPRSIVQIQPAAVRLVAEFRFGTRIVFATAPYPEELLAYP